MVHRVNDAAGPAALSDEQFDELARLLTPGFELATLMLADWKRTYVEKVAPVAPDAAVAAEAPAADADG